MINNTWWREERADLWFLENEQDDCASKDGNTFQCSSIIETAYSPVYDLQ